MSLSFGLWESVIGAVGWIYVIAWGLCLYPQVWLNFKRKSVGGLSLEFALSNLIGYTCYTIFNEFLVLNKGIRETYISYYQLDHAPAQLNDLIFSAHGNVLTFVVVIQFLLYQNIPFHTKTVYGFFTFCIFFFLFWLKAYILDNPTEWMSFIGLMGSIKIICTILKYGPQAYLNYIRKSTQGYSIHSSILDFIGGSFSVMQILLNSWLLGSPKLIFGNIPKLALGLLAIIFTTIFIFQHFILYPGSAKLKKDIDNNPL